MTESQPSRWSSWAAQLRQLLQERQAHVARTVVLLPYAQLLPLAQRAWAQAQPEGFAPRFETTQTFSRGWPAPAPGELDYRGDVASDALTARVVLERSGLRAQAELAAGLLLQVMPELAQRAAAMAPAQRPAWAQQARALLASGLQCEELRLEAALGQAAVTWAAHSSYPTDLFFSSAAQQQLDCLVLVPGLQPDPWIEGLCAAWGERCATLPLPERACPAQATVHQALDLEDEAQRAAACVLRHLQAQRAPVAVVVIDRLLTRRLRALLLAQGVALRDETGWKLSTSRAAARLMAGLRAAAWDADSDTVLDWIKQLPALEPDFVLTLEAALRRRPRHRWDAAAAQLSAQWVEAPPAGWARLQRWREQLQGRRALPQWLQRWREVLQECGLWTELLQDPVGLQALSALRLLAQDAAGWTPPADWARRSLELAGFTHWADQVLEAASFRPDAPAQEQVVLLPLAHLYGREFAALVLPGCDELRLPASAEAAGLWTQAQRQLLGLPTRAQLEAALRLAWDDAVRRPAVDLLWRRADDSGEALMPSPLVQLLQLQGGAAAAGADPRETRAVTPHARPAAAPRAAELALATVSASAYEDLRRCPYRYFALRLLGLREAEELQAELGARDVGSWVHAALQVFHDRLDQPGAPRAQRRAWLDAAAQQAEQALQLDPSELLPYRSAWPRLREGYLDWLAAHEAQGWRYAQGEWDLQRHCGDVILQGRIDRLDLGGDGQLLLIDYKTEPWQRTRQRLQDPLEDTQLAFYAVLHGGSQLSAAYLNLSTSGHDDDPVGEVAHPDLEGARQALQQGLQDELARIAAGAPLPALGEGPSCEHCAARGLCRRDFWALGQEPR